MTQAASSLAGQVVLVTGAAKRIGRGIALRLAEEGARVAIHYNRSEAEARRTAEESARRRAVPREPGERSRNRPYVRRNRGTLRPPGRPGEQRRALHPHRPARNYREDWDFIHSVNLKAVFFCCQNAARLMRKAGGGRIVNISSLGGLRPWAEHVHYCASKAGVVMLTRALAKAFAPEITVNSVAPGVIPFDDIDESGRQMIAATPARRGGTPAEVAAAVAYFLKASNFVTGQILAVDGGLSQK